MTMIALGWIMLIGNKTISIFIFNPCFIYEFQPYNQKRWTKPKTENDNRKKTMMNEFEIHRQRNKRIQHFQSMNSKWMYKYRTKNENEKKPKTKNRKRGQTNLKFAHKETNKYKMFNQYNGFEMNVQITAKINPIETSLKTQKVSLAFKQIRM
jgi:hypothetical protein